MLHSLTVSRRGSLSRKFFATAAVALLLAAPVQADPGFTINLQFSGTTTAQQQQAFINAKAYWESMISGYSTTGASSLGPTMSGITINADVSAIDGLHGILGQAGPDDTATQGGITYTSVGSMQFDSADVAVMIANNSFGDVIRHEMGHVLGIGTLWSENLLRRVNDDTVTPPAKLPVDGYFDYIGANARAGWRIEFNQFGAVPIEKGGGFPGTAGGHWDEADNGAKPTGIVSRFKGADFMYEMMTGWANVPVYTSNVTVGGIVDLGYTIKAPTANVSGVYNFDRTFLTTPEANANDFNLGRLSRFGMMVWGKLSGNNSVVVNADSDAVVAIMAANDYTGGTTVTSGTLVVGNVAALGTGGVVVNGGILDIGGFDLTLPTLTVTGGGIASTFGTITVNAPAMDMRAGEVQADLLGGAALNKTTSGTLTLSGFNEYTGGTNIDGGTVIANNWSALSNGAVNISNGSTLLVGAQVSVLNTVTLNDGTIGAVPTDPTDTFAVTPSISANAFVLKSGTVSAIIAGGTVTKTGPGTVTLSGANTFTQGTTVTGGTLVLANASALGSGQVTVAGGTLDVGTTAVSTAGSLILNSGSVVGSTGSLTASSFTLRDGVVSAVLAGAGAMTKETSGTVTLSGVNTFTGGITVSGGTLIGAAADTLGSGNVSLDAGTLQLTHALAAEKAAVNLAGGALTFGTLTEATIGSIAGSTDFALTNDNTVGVALTVGGNNASTTYSGIMSGPGSLTKIGSGELTLTGANTYTGGTTVSAGTLTLGVANALGGAVTVNGGTLNLGALAVSLGSIVLDGGAIAGSGGTLDAAAYDLRSGTVGVSLIGGAVTKSGTGDITLSLANTYTGGTVVNGGRLVVGAVGALSNGTVTVNTGGTLDIGAFSMSGMDTLTVDGGTVTGTSGAYIASDFQAKSGVIAVRLQGAASLTKTTAGTVTLSASNGFLGGVAVNEGVLVITNSGALGTGATAVASGATLRVGDGTTAFGPTWTGNAIALNGGTLELALTSTTSLNRALTGTGGVVQNGTGTVTLTNATYTGDTTVNAGRLVLPVARLDLIWPLLRSSGTG